MSQNLPIHWEVVQLNKVFQFTTKPRGLQYSSFSTIPFVPMELIPAGSLFFSHFVLKPSKEITSGTYFEPGDFLIAKITPSFENGKQGIINSLPNSFGIATTEVIPIKEIPNVSNKQFLAYYLLRREIRSELAAKMEGSTGRQRLSKSTLENLKVPLPPLPEQQQIAHTLQTIQQAKETRQRELELEQERKAALMQHLFTYGTRGEARKQTEIGEIPEGWEVVKLGNWCEFLQYGTSTRCDANKTETPVLRVPNVIRGCVDISDLKFIERTNREVPKLKLKIGDLQKC